MSLGGIRLAGVGVTGILLAAFLFLRDGGEERIQPTRGGTLTVAIEAEPESFNGLTHGGEGAALVTRLTQAPLVRQDPSTRQLEAWLAEGWDASADGRSATLSLRRDIAWSDGTPFTAADVRFTVETVLDPATRSPLAPRLTTSTGRLEVVTPHPHAVTIRMPADAVGGALGAVVDLPIFPRHALESSRATGTLGASWGPSMAADAFAGMGPFLFGARDAGGRIVFERNPRYWRRGHDGTELPYLDRLVLAVQEDNGRALARLRSGEVDLVADPLPPGDYPEARRAERSGEIGLLERGVSTRPDAFWFCLAPERARDRRWAFVGRVEFRRALSHAVDRESFAQTVYYGQAVPVWGAVTPGSSRYFNPNVPRYPPDAAIARELLAQAGLEDRTGDGVIEDASGTAARFVAIAPDTERARSGAAALTAALGAVGVTVDMQFLNPPDLGARLSSCDYEMAYAPAPESVTADGVRLEFWLSSGSAHVWNPRQPQASTEWEAEIDRLIVQYANAPGDGRQELFHEVQRVLGEHVPMIYLAAPRLFLAHRARVHGLVAAPDQPPLWNADSVHVIGSPFVAAR